MNYEIKTLKTAIEYIGKLSEDEINSITDLAKHSEWSVAIENLFLQIAEHDLNISPTSFDKIKLMAQKMDLAFVPIEDMGRV